jgi:hypothetical protein
MTEESRRTLAPGSLSTNSPVLFILTGEVEEIFSKLPEAASEKMQFRTVYPNRVRKDPRFSRWVRGDSLRLHLEGVSKPRGISVESDPSSGIEEILGWPTVAATSVPLSSPTVLYVPSLL